MRLIDGRYECALCGAVLDIPLGREPNITIKAASGKPNLRVLSCNGIQIHACEVGEPRPAESERSMPST